MKQEDFKNKMDQIDHIFDSEALWSNIEQKKERRRFFWLIPIGGLLLLSLIGYLIVYDFNAVDTTANNGVNTVMESMEHHGSLYKNQKNKKTEIKDIESSLKKVAHDENRASGVKSGSKINLQKAILSGKTNDSNATIGSDLTQRMSASDVEDALDKTTIAADDAKPYTQDEQNVAIEKDLDLKEELAPYDDFLQQPNGDVTLDFKGNDDKPQGFTDFQRITALSPSINYDRPKYILNSKLESALKTRREKSIVLGLKAGIGYDFHTFTQDTNMVMRGEYERPLEVLSIGVLVKKRLKNNFIIEGNIQWSRSQTKAERSDFSSAYSLDQGSGVILREWERTDYNFFNEYYRLDALLSIGYPYNLSNSWTIAPKLSLGYNLLNYQKGQYWNDQLATLILDSAPEYKSNSSFFIGGSVGIERTWNNDIHTGINIGVQSLRRLTKETGYQHELLPVSLQFIFGKRL